MNGTISFPSLASRHRYGLVLVLLLAAFVFRVGGQFLQLVHPTRVLPPFAAWDSQTLPYGALLTVQIVLIALIAYLIVRLISGRIRPKPGTGKALFFAGIVYFAFMAFRLIAGLTFLANVAWFG